MGYYWIPDWAKHYLLFSKLSLASLLPSRGDVNDAERQFKNHGRTTKLDDLTTDMERIRKIQSGIDYIKLSVSGIDSKIKSFRKLQDNVTAWNKRSDFYQGKDWMGTSSPDLHKLAKNDLREKFLPYFGGMGLAHLAGNKRALALFADTMQVTALFDSNFSSTERVIRDRTPDL